MGERDNPDHITEPGSQELPTVVDAIELRNSMMVMMERSQQQSIRAIRHWAISVVLIVLLGMSVTVWYVRDIRTTQNAHTPAFLCQTGAINGLLHDVPLASTGDTHRSDYAKIPKYCPVHP